MMDYSDKTSELALLVSATLSKQALFELVKLDVDDFYFESCKIIFSAIKSIHEDNQSVDLMALRSKLKERNQYDKVGGDKMLTDFARHGSAVNITSVIKTILECSARRKLLSVSEGIHEKIKNASLSTKEILNDINNDLRGVNKSTDDYIFDCEKITELDVKNFCIEGNYLKTGFVNLDDIIVGLFKGELSILGARPGIGKSAFALNIARNIGETHSVLFFSLEMTTLQMVLRLISAETKIDQDIIRRGKIIEEEFNLIGFKSKELRKLSITFVDRVFDLWGIVNTIHKISAYKKIDLVIVDYLQLINVPGEQQRYIQIGEISRSFKQLAIDLKIPIMALSQLNRASEDRQPQLRDLRESGNIEQDADVVIFLHHKIEDPLEEIRLQVEKNRSGKTRRSKLVFKGSHLKFYDFDFRSDHMPWEDD